MKLKMVVNTVLLGFVALSLGAIIFKELRPSPAGASPTATVSSTEVSARAPEQPQFVVYYFHGNIRCTTCQTIETQSHAAILAGFPEQLGSGRLQWRVVNYDAPENAHYRDDFQLAFQSVILAEEIAGRPVRWKNLEDVWTQVHEPSETFTRYIMDSTKGFLAGGA